MFLFLIINDKYLYAVSQAPKTIEIFKDESEFRNYVLNDVKFNNISFQTVQIENGDNFWKVAKKYDVNIDTLIGCNPYWDNLNAKLKQTVIVPNKKGTLHFVYSIKAVDDIANLYGVDKSQIEIQNLPFISKFTGTNNDKPIALFVYDVKPVTENMTETLADQFALREKFRSPLGGRLSSFYGNRKHPIFQNRQFHNGLDIAARYGTGVGASREGKVIGTGWMGGYGKAVIVDHGDGYRTLYGHLSSIAVRPGQNIKAGQFIGRVGSTGFSTGPHLHFTLWQGNRLINPLKVLW